MASIKEEYKDKIEFIDVDFNDPNSQDVIKKFNITKYPVTIFIDKDSNVVQTMTGFGDSSKSELDENIEKLLK